MALAAVCPSPVFCVDAVAVVGMVRARFAEPAGGAAGTVMVMVSGGLVRVASRATREKVSVEPAAGAVKVGRVAVVLDRVTVGPEVWVQA